MKVPKLGRLSKGGAALIGFAIAAVLIPGAAIAATNLVTIANASHTHEAGVTSASQLLATEAGAASFVIVQGIPGTCAANGFYKVPAGKALIITTLNFYDFNVGAGHNELDLLAGPAATPCTKFLAAGVENSADVSENQVFQPGIAVPAGDALGMLAVNDDGSVHMYGYLVPAAAVPATALDSLPKVRPGHPATISGG